MPSKNSHVNDDLAAVYELKLPSVRDQLADGAGMRFLTAGTGLARIVENPRFAGLQHSSHRSWCQPSRPR